MRKTAAGWLMTAFLVGCGGSYTHHERQAVEEARGPSELILDKVVVERDDQSRRLSLDEPVFAGDRVALGVTLPRPAYLYVVNLAPDGSSQVVWPSHAPRLVDGGARIPDASWFELAGASGPEVVALIATTTRVPLSEAGRRALVRVANKQAARTDLVKVQASHPPGFFPDGHATMGFRAEQLRATGGAVRVRTGDETVVLLVDLDHREPAG